MRGRGGEFLRNQHVFVNKFAIDFLTKECNVHLEALYELLPQVIANLLKITAIC